jgi:uncharacterized Zn finger protein
VSDTGQNDALSRLTETTLRKTAGATSFARGEDYVRYVHGLRIADGTATGSIQAKRVYLVDLDWSLLGNGGPLEGRCTCPHHAKGNFCKHLVALGLAVMDETGVERRTAPVGEPEVDPDKGTAAYLQSLEAPALRQLVDELRHRYPEIERTLQVRSSARGAGGDGAAKELTGMVQGALRVRGFVDYRRSFDVAQQAHEVLDELETHLGAGAADVVRPALLKALNRLRTITEHADDSSGSLGDACQRAADLYARSCCEGVPDRVKLAKWLVRFRDDSPGWPETTLADFAAAFDDKALAAYRKGVVALDAKYAESDRWGRFEVDRMVLELADHDGDVDAAVRLLARGDHPDFAGIVDRLSAAERHDEAFEWLERAVAAGAVSTHSAAGASWLTPEGVAEAFVDRGRPEEALAVQRKAFAERPEVPRFRALIELAERVGSAQDERATAFELLAEKARAPYGSGAARVQIAIAERDLETAWQVAQEYGAGYAWQELAGALMADHPGRAAELHQPHIDEALKVTDSSRYVGIAAQLSLVKELCGRSGQSVEFAAYVDGIRQRYGRRPALMAAMDRHGL